LTLKIFLLQVMQLLLQ